MNSNQLQHDLLQVLGGYAFFSGAMPRIQFLRNAGGYSGASIWKLQHDDDTVYCIRRWPSQHPAPPHLAWIHSIQSNARDAGLQFVPKLVKTKRGETFIVHHSHLWQVEQWMPGSADYWQSPNDQKLCDAFRCLARFHNVTGRRQNRNNDVPPAVTSRINLFDELRRGGLRRIETAINVDRFSSLVSDAKRFVELYRIHNDSVSTELQQWSEFKTELIPCLRDVWHDHVLFSGDCVSGFVDFGAMRFETVAGDIARLIGSLAGDDQKLWRTAIQAYNHLRPLNEVECDLVRILDRSSVLLSGVNWLKWIWLDRIEFNKNQDISRRFRRILERLERFAETGSGLFD